MKLITLFWLVLTLNLAVILANAYAFIVVFGWLTFILTNTALVGSWLATMYMFRMTYIRTPVAPIES